jgi:hypothetical protein
MYLLLYQEDNKRVPSKLTYMKYINYIKYSKLVEVELHV